MKLINNIGVPARIGAWLFRPRSIRDHQPDASQMKLDAKAYLLASIGETVGFADYTAFMATGTIHS